MNKHLKITIEGSTSVGKTAISMVLIEIFEKYGIDFSYTNLEELYPEKFLDEKLKSIAKKGVKVEILEKQVPREMKRPKTPPPQEQIRGDQPI